MTPLLELLAAYVHGVLAFGHLLGIVFNWKTRKKGTIDGHVAMHSIWMAYDVWCARKHWRRRRPAPLI